MRSYWMIRLFAYGFVGCLMIYVMDPINNYKPRETLAATNLTTLTGSSRLADAATISKRKTSTTIANPRSPTRAASVADPSKGSPRSASLTDNANSSKPRASSSRSTSPTEPKGSSQPAASEESSSISKPKSSTRISFSDLSKQESATRLSAAVTTDHATTSKRTASRTKTEAKKPTKTRRPTLKPVVKTPKPTTNTTATITAQDDPSAGLQLCRMNPAPVLGEVRDRLWAGDDEHPLKMLRQEYFRYRCAGQPYEDYMQQHLLPYIRQKQAQHPTWKWGQRPSILPPSAGQNRSILVIGNSHTQQMMGALLCQYRPLMIRSVPLQKGVEDGIEYRFENGLKVYVMLNHGAVYSARWKKNLEQVLGKSLRRMDAILYGHINAYDPKYDAAKLWEKMRNYAQKFPEFQVDIYQYPGGFSIEELAQQYQGRILWVSMTSAYNMVEHELIVEQLQNLTATTGRTNLLALNARQHIAEMGGMECSSDDNAKIGTCATDPRGKTYSNGHKCMGAYGGEPDVVAYNVVEALWKMFTSPSLAVTQLSAEGRSER